MSLSQNLQQKLLQKLSPQQIQLMKLLQVPTANLEERIKEELEENPALEVTDEDGADNYEEKDEFADTAPAEEEYESEERDRKICTRISTSPIMCRKAMTISPTTKCVTRTTVSRKKKRQCLIK